MNSGQNKINLTASVMKQLEGDSVHGFGFAQSRAVQFTSQDNDVVKIQSFGGVTGVTTPGLCPG